jgi:adenylate cyclase class 2
MCAEIEAKLKVDSLQEIRQRLERLGAGFLGEQLQTDCHFDDADKTLQKSDRCLRIRRQSSNQVKEFFLTYKGAKEKSRLKKRQELEIKIEDADSTEKLLLALGYKKVLTIEKKRSIWQLGECEVALDELPLLGEFVEIEGPDEEKIAAVQKALQLSDSPHIPKSYASLMKETLCRLGRTQTEVLL